MSGLLVIIVLGTLILILGLRLVLQSSNAGAQSPSVTIEEFANAREALDTVFVEAAAIERIFSTEDMEFVSHASAPKAQRRFMKERKTLAIQWLRKMQKQVAELMDLHLRLAGYTHEPNPRFELKLTVSICPSCSFLTLCCSCYGCAVHLRLGALLPIPLALPGTFALSSASACKA